MYSVYIVHIIDAISDIYFGNIFSVFLSATKKELIRKVVKELYIIRIIKVLYKVSNLLNVF